VKKFLDQEVSGAKEKGYVMTLNGRKRWLHDIASKNHAVRANAERMAMNTPLQGTAADLMKLAMIEIDKRLEKGGYQSKLIIQVHDEVLLDCPKKEVEEVKNLVTESMEGAMSLDVPLRVNSASGNNWMEL
jgi:DNA polymerase-1